MWIWQFLIKIFTKSFIIRGTIYEPAGIRIEASQFHVYSKANRFERWRGSKCETTSIWLHPLISCHAHTPHFGSVSFQQLPFTRERLLHAGNFEWHFNQASFSPSSPCNSCNEYVAIIRHWSHGIFIFAKNTRSTRCINRWFLSGSSETERSRGCHEISS